ncbi:MAG: YdiU family protein [Deltaproteobacteria bacterium]|nr:YdiU family protein [Deltaproteobacteria bacterium]
MQETQREPLDLCNDFVRSLPGDPREGGAPRQVHGALYSRVSPSISGTPTLIAHSQALSAQLGLTEAFAANSLTDVLGGARTLRCTTPYAQCYGGHQFGRWAAQLGDGRAITLGELTDTLGQRQELQLKGAGRTPYSRGADGRAVLRSSIREYLCSESMWALGVPTTRALSLVATGEGVMRDMFYNGNARTEPGAVVCRVAPSFVRFGSFELPSSRGDHALLGKLTDYVISRFYQDVVDARDVGGRIEAFFSEVARRTGILLAHWYRVGFVHGVMNTDNLSILGLTIDYGPYGWLDTYDPMFTPNTTDLPGRRYCFARQRSVARWNLEKLAQALAPLVPNESSLSRGLAHFDHAFDQTFHSMVAHKLGLGSLAGPDDDSFIEALYAMLGAVETDPTIWFRALGDVPLPSDLSAISDEQLLHPLRDAYYQADSLEGAHRARTTAWLRQYWQRVMHEGATDSERRARSHKVNPVYIPRNYLAQEAIDHAEHGDYQPLHTLLSVLEDPYTVQANREHYAGKRPDWARDRAGCSALSCSS